MGEELVTGEAAARELERLKEQQFRFILLLSETGLPAPQLAMKLAKGDKKKAKAWRMKYQRWSRDPRFAELVSQQVQGTFLLGLPQAGNALVSRASKGNVPAIKLLMEASGFHNPRVTHEHTGDIAISFKGLNRPPSVSDDEEDPIVEATVVEE